MPKKKKKVEHLAPEHTVPLPANFAPEFSEAWFSLPLERLPTTVVFGKMTYTLRNENSAVVEVNLARKAFFYKKKRGGDGWQGPRTHAWSSCNSVAEAWMACKTALEWDERACDL